MKNLERCKNKVRISYRYNVEKQQVAIVEAVMKKDKKMISKLQIGRMQSYDCQYVAVSIGISNETRFQSSLNGMEWSTNEDKTQVIEWLGEVMKDPKTYKATALKTVVIQDPITKEKRERKIPTRKDRAAQLVYWMATDPVVECKSDRNSFGFRKNRTGREAVHLARFRIASNWGPKYYRKTKVEKSNRSLIHKIRLKQRPNEPYSVFVDQWLKMGCMEFGLEKMETIGVVSQLFCNEALNGMESYFQKKGRRVDQAECIRYADEIIVRVDNVSTVDNVKSVLAEFLKKRGLIIKETTEGSVDDGFDYLGWHIFRSKRWYNKKVDIKATHVAKAIPSRDEIVWVQNRVTAEIGTSRKRDSIIASLNPKLKEWCKKYASSQDSRKIFKEREIHISIIFSKWNGKTDFIGDDKDSIRSDGPWPVDKYDRVRYRPTIHMKCVYPTFKKLGEWDDSRKTINPYKIKPGYVKRL